MPSRWPGSRPWPKRDSSTLQLLQNSANLPMVAKPLYGVVSDAVYIRGQHRKAVHTCPRIPDWELSCFKREGPHMGRQPRRRFAAANKLKRIKLINLF
ncbi:hypothetical protein [Mangrovicoccus ximenensis]|uniref:hypothetical protein n=1 Tax=Mangrovicoccus ximenensis TaxID=1911570 RepID=UPI000D3335C5